MHLWDLKRAGIHIWDFWMFTMSETGNHSESYSPKPTKPRNIDLHNNVIFRMIKFKDEMYTTIKKIKIWLQIFLVCRYRMLGMQIWTFSKHHIFKYDFWEKTRYSNMNFWCFLFTPVGVVQSAYFPQDEFLHEKRTSWVSIWMEIWMAAHLSLPFARNSQHE